MSDTTLPSQKNAFSFDPSTRAYLGAVTVFLSPLEGQYFLPDNVVEFAPPSGLAPNTSCRLNVAGDGWDVVPDFRRVMLYTKANATPVANTLQLGELPPQDVTAVPPAIFSDTVPRRNAWDEAANAWREIPDYSRHHVYDKATGEFVASPAPGAELPDTQTTQMPPPPQKYRAPQWNEASNTWDVVPDFRGVTYWLPDGSEHVVDELGVDLPPFATTEPPVPQDNAEA